MADSPQPAEPTPPVLAPNLEAQLTCSICTDLLHQPLTLLDCLHTFCGACLKEWFHFQALRIETAPGPPPPAGVPIFTCPSCREGVRDTRHDARVFSLLDMFVALNPGVGKSEEEKKEMDGRYKRGEGVMPKIQKIEGRTEEERRLDEEERRLVEEVRRVSLREATERVAGAAGRDGGRGAGGRGALRVEGESGRRRRSESRQREVDAAAGARQVEHQSSLRNLISADGMDVRDIEREVEEFARQIQEEGLLDGLDLDNLDLENNDELSRKITEAYRRRHRERRRDGGRRSNASAHSHRSDISARPRSRTDDGSRPTSRHAPRSRAPSVSSNEERGRYPPSSSALLDVQEPARRRRTSSGSWSATLPVVTTQPDARIGSRAQTDLTSRSRDAHVRRPSMGIEVRSASSPTTATVPVTRGDSPANRGLPFSARAAAGLGVAQPEARSSSTSSRQRTDRPPALDIRPESPTLGSMSAPISPSLVSPPLSPQRPQLPRYKEPLINCSSCRREHIEYELHFNCSLCHDGNWNICLDCWRRGKGCLHWFGFGHTAWARWEKLNLTGPPTPPPHVLTANRYLPPKQIPGGAEGRRVLTTENPLDRLQTGTFCSRCAAWTNDCHWSCDACNEGEWGFCTDCVGQGKACTHPLLALAYHPPPAPPSPSSPAASPSLISPPAITSPTTTTTGTFHPVPPTPKPCSACRVPIPEADSHFHCYSCPSSLDSQPKKGGYDLCSGCYTSLVSDGSVSAENGPAGWRRCPRGHRMVVVGFVAAAEERGEQGQVRWRVVERDRVGGRRLKFEEYTPHTHAQHGQGLEGGVKVASWWEDGGKGKKMERLFSGDVRASTAGVGEGRFVKVFPPDGGTAPRAVAGWGWVPGAGGEDELLFPKGAEVLEVEEVNDEWFHGFYMGAQGLFPAPFVRFVGR